MSSAKDVKGPRARGPEAAPGGGADPEPPPGQGSDPEPVSYTHL
ncbi:hypothetical protein [Streptomyces sp. b62]|nr:hypothetical protein [Streptomyces sp. b62]